MTGQENTVNERSCLHSSLWKQSRAGLKSVGAVELCADRSVAVLLWGCKWCKMLIALSFLLIVPAYHLFCSIMTVIWLFFWGGGMGFKSFCTQNLPTKAVELRL